MISIFELFSIGIGPSSSHTVGPMRAALAFAKALADQNLLLQVAQLHIETYGSLAYTGQGHGTEAAILMGLEGYAPESIDPDLLPQRSQAILNTHEIFLHQQHLLPFHFEQDFVINKTDLLPLHSNGMKFQAWDQQNRLLLEKRYYSVGGGFILDEQESALNNPAKAYPWPFASALELFALCTQHQVSIAELMMRNETQYRSREAVRQGVLNIASVMRSAIDRGCTTPGSLPGILQVKRRAPGLYEKLLAQGRPKDYQHTNSMDWLNVFAIAVNEENAAGSRVVTAPTNGAAGTLPSVLRYFETFYPDATPDKTIDFLLTAAAIAVLYKKGASISAAEVGCQGEVGVACSMAAGALTAVCGGSLLQIENASEMAMEHHLGLTCDPIAGLVQIPCIERNAVGAVKAVNLARLALMETGEDKKVSLDKVIATMLETGKDMSRRYKETSLGGLAKIQVNVVEC